VSTALITLTVLGYAGFGLVPALAPSSDSAVDSTGSATLLIALNPSWPNFLLVSNTLGPEIFFGFGIPRVLLSDPLYYLLGWWFGATAITWMERRTRTWGDMLRRVEDSFGRYGYLFLFALPYPQLLLLAGAARLPFLRVLVVRAAGIALRLYLVRRGGEAASGPLSRVTDFISEYRWPLLAVTVTLVVLSFVMELKKDDGTVESLAHLDDEMDRIERGGGDRPEQEPSS
jgi:membrane protein DedA with SNARE-associated domain